MFACVTLLISKTHFLLVALHLLTLRRLGAYCQLGRGSGSSDGDSLLVVDGGDPTCAGVPRSPQSQRSHQTAAAPNSCNTRNQNQFCQLCRRRLYMEHCHVSCGDIFGHFHSFNETNLQIFGRNPSVPGVHKPANNSQLLDVMGTSFTDGVETRCQNMVPKVYTFLSFSFVGILAQGSIASGGIVASAKFSRSYLRFPLSPLIFLQVLI